MTEPVVPSAEETAALCELVEQRAGIFIDPARREYLVSDLAGRIAASGHAAAASYLAHLRGPEGAAELDALVEIAVINETYFFREPNHFRALTGYILPALAAQRRTAVTIWSAGCSTGEEPYSIAIAVLKAQEHLRGLNIKVLGTDVSARAIGRAQLGHYTKNSFRGISEADLKSYFVARPRHYEVKDEVRELVDFRVLNLLEGSSDRYFDGLDVIFCRNVTIYFREATIKRLNRRLANSLRGGGYLVFGSSETLQHQDAALQLREIEGAFIYRKIDTGRVEERPSPPRRDRSGRLPRIRNPSSSSSIPRMAAAAPEKLLAPKPVDTYAAALELVREERFDAALEVLERLTAPRSAGTDALALLASVLMSRESFDRALALLSRAMDRDPLRPELHLLAGLCHRHKGEQAKALEKLKRAVFLAPDSYIAHFQLAETLRKMGKTPDAVRGYRNAGRLLGSAAPLPDALQLVMAGFPRDYIARVCERHAGA